MDSSWAIAWVTTCVPQAQSPDPWEDPQRRSLEGFLNMTHLLYRGTSFWGSTFWILPGVWEDSQDLRGTAVACAAKPKPLGFFGPSAGQNVGPAVTERNYNREGSHVSRNPL